MDLDANRQAEAIAAEWGVDVSLLEQAHWTVETIDGADGELYGYVVRFDDDDTPPDVLTKLGLRFGQLERELSINAFDEPDEGSYGSGRYGSGTYGSEHDDDPDDGIYSINEPLPDISDFIDGDEEDEAQFPDLPPGQSYLTDENDDVLTDEEGRGIIVELSDRELRREIEENLDRVDRSVQEFQNLVRRFHNNPPELFEYIPSPQGMIDEIAHASRELRSELASPTPNIENAHRQISVLQKLGKILWSALAVVTTGVVGNVATDALKGDYTIPYSLYESLHKVAEIGHAWLKVLPLGP